MTPQEMRKGAAAILLSTAAFFEAHPDRWLKHAMAQTEDRNIVPSWHEDACSFCALARIIVEAGGDTDLINYSLALDAMQDQILAAGWQPPRRTPETSITTWNDAQIEVKPVIDMLRTAAATFA